MKKRLSSSSARKRLLHRNKHKLTVRRQTLFVQELDKSH